MKNIIIKLLLLHLSILVTTRVNAQTPTETNNNSISVIALNDSLFRKLDKTKITSGVLYDRVNPIGNAKDYGQADILLNCKTKANITNY
jgi:hypothetical protein